MKLKKFNKIMEEYLESFDCEYGGIDTDFYCYPKTQEIFVSFTIVESADKYFNELVEELGLNYKCDPFLLGLYHEIGHCVTFENFTKAQLKKIMKDKARVDDGNPTEEKRKEYVRLLDEYTATKWAVDFINNNPQEVKDFWEKIQPEILKFYKKKGLTN